MARFQISIDWGTPIYPNKDDHSEHGNAVTERFQRWLITGNISWRGEAFVLSIGLIGLSVTLYLSKPWARS